MRFSSDGSLSRESFLADYWQRRPCLIRQALPGFIPALDANDVAGLACEELAETRLVSGNFEQQNWMVRHGPFTERELRRLPEGDWTLLVQDVEKHYPPLQSLLAEFDFLPSWRLDDLMISVAAPGGSVGPHVDQYDVFLLQAAGNRRWRIAQAFGPELLEGCDLKVLKSFAPEQEWDLAPGDMLYLPPGIAHHGIALDECMTWSIGLRAPSQADLLLALGEWLAERWQEGSRYTDEPLTGLPRPGEFNRVAASRMRALLQTPFPPPDQVDGFLAGFLSRYRLAQEPAAPEEILKEQELAMAIGKGATLRRNPWTRLVWIEEDGRARLFAAGEEFCCSVEMAVGLCDTSGRVHLEHSPDAEGLGILCRLVNSGHLYLGG